MKHQTANTATPEPKNYMDWWKGLKKYGTARVNDEPHQRAIHKKYYPNQISHLNDIQI